MEQKSKKSKKKKQGIIKLDDGTILKRWRVHLHDGTYLIAWSPTENLAYDRSGKDRKDIDKIEPEPEQE